MRSAFPNSAHLSEATFASLTLLGGFLLAVFGGLVDRGETVFDPRLALLVVGLALMICLAGFTRVRAIRPFCVWIGAKGLEVETPPGAPLAVQDLGGDGPRRHRGGRWQVAWSAGGETQLQVEGLLVSAGAKRWLLPWRYCLPCRMWARLGVLDYATFRYDELQWIAGLIERFRSGDSGAATDLRGWLPDRAPVPTVEEPSVIVRGLGPGRLHVLAVALPAAIAWWFAVATR